MKASEEKNSMNTERDVTLRKVTVECQTRRTYKLVVFRPPGGRLKEFHLGKSVVVVGEQNKLDLTGDY